MAIREVQKQFQRSLKELQRWTGREIAKAKRQAVRTVARGVVQSIRDDREFQTAQLEVLAGEVTTQLERMQDYGFTAVPELSDDDVEAFVVYLGGNREHGVIIKLDRRKDRPKNLKPGESKQYNSKRATHIYLKDDGTAEINCDLEVDGTIHATGSVNADGDVTAGGNVEDSTGTMQTMRDIYNTHKHANANNSAPKDAGEKMDGSA